MSIFNTPEMSAADDRLRGTVALVHPDLECDPLNKRNQIGVISEADIDLDNIYVDFKDKVGLFSADALLVLLPPDDIHQNLADLAYDVAFPDLKALTQIDLFLRYGDGNVNTRFKAMAIARDNPAIQPLCVEALNKKISRNLSNQHGRD
jgi:hypothetical protein